MSKIREQSTAAQATQSPTRKPNAEPPRRPCARSHQSKESKMKQYRNNGAVGALLDEYEKAIFELQNVISEIAPSELELIVDHETNDPDCKSIQTILTHVIRAGFGMSILNRYE